ncbi:MAG: UDP-glucose 4-epimerase GalE [Bacteroidota bacterium]
MHKILVTGGCGYIGSHTMVDLIQNGFEVISVDNFSNASAEALDGVEQITGVRVQNYALDLGDREGTLKVFAEHPDIKGVIHFAAHKHVGESTKIPMQYFRNNLNSLLNILEGCKTYQVPHLIFSSSCSVYGNSRELPVTEKTPFERAESPYARTKQMGEMIIEDASLEIPGLQSILLRYFNPAGAHPSALLGEASSNPASNLVPVITETAIGKRAKMTVFGDNWNTRDGSCIRDYIHVMDLADAHTKCLQYLMAEKNDSQVEIFNVGIGDGVSVLEAVEAFEKVTAQKLNYEIGPRRDGDVESIYADCSAAQKRLGWTPQYGIEEIMRTAWAWEQKRTQLQEV